MIIAIEGLDITYFETLDHAENYLEAVDIADNAYEIFNSEGLEVETHAIEIRKKFLKLIPYSTLSFKLKIGKADKSARLKELIIKSLNYSKNVPQDINSLSLLELIELGKKYFTVYKKNE